MYLYPYFSPCDGTLDALDDVDDASCHQKLITRTADIYVLFFIPRGRGGSIARFHRVTGMKTVETSFKEKAKRHLLTHRTRRTFVFVIPHNTHTPHTHHTHTHTPNTMALSHPVRAHDDDDDDGDGGGDAWVIASGRGMTRAGTDETYYYVYSLSQLQSNESFFRDVFRDADDVRSVPSSAC